MSSECGTCQMCDGVPSPKGLWSHFWWLDKPLVPLLQHNWCSASTREGPRNMLMELTRKISRNRPTYLA